MFDFIIVSALQVVYTLSDSTVQKMGLHQVQALSGMMSAELAMSGVSCLLSSHVLSDRRQLYESQVADRRHFTIHCRRQSTWSVSVTLLTIFCPPRLCHSTPTCTNNASSVVTHFAVSITRANDACRSTNQELSVMGPFSIIQPNTAHQLSDPTRPKPSQILKVDPNQTKLPNPM